MPVASTNDLLLAAANEIIVALHVPSGPTLTPSEATARRDTLSTNHEPQDPTNAQTD